MCTNRNQIFADGIVRVIGVVIACIAAVLSISELSDAKAESGIASIYAYSGTKTASGERANPAGFTASHHGIRQACTSD